MEKIKVDSLSHSVFKINALYHVLAWPKVPSGFFKIYKNPKHFLGN